MIISLNKSQWNIMLNEFARTIKPCGWLELMELQIDEMNFTKTAKKFRTQKILANQYGLFFSMVSIHDGKKYNTPSRILN